MHALCRCADAVAGLGRKRFAQHVRGGLGARRTLDLIVRLSMVTTPPALLEPPQQRQVGSHQ